jgi:hypothetical protein
LHQAQVVAGLDQPGKAIGDSAVGALLDKLGGQHEQARPAALHKSNASRLLQ